MSDTSYNGFLSPENLQDPDIVPPSDGQPLRLTIRPSNPLSSLVKEGGVQLVPVDHDPFSGELQMPPVPEKPRAARNLVDRLLGVSGPRYQTWPERMVRSGATLAGDMMKGDVSYVPGLRREDVTDQPRPGGFTVAAEPNDAVIERSQDMAGLMTGGGIPAAEKGALGAVGGKLVQPSPPVFYSAAERALEAAPQAKASPEQWVGWLKNQPGVKAEELQWLGLDDPKNLPVDDKGVVTKQSLLEHTQGHGPQIKEVEKSGSKLNEDSIGERAQQIMEQDYPELTPDHAEYYGHFDEATTWAEAEIRSKGSATKFHGYQLPGGDNYRETLLTLPEKGTKGALARYEEINRLAERRNLTEAESAEQVALERALTHQGGGHAAGDTFHSSHWDEPNVIAHLRMNDRDIPDVGKSLRLEELQSDWHQQGRKQGYASDRQALLDDAIAAGKKAIAKQQLYGEKHPDAIAARDEYVKASDRLTAFDRKGSVVPNAPFKQSWPDLLLKRAITKAAREGKDAVSWTPGEQQAARYDLSKHIDQLEYNEKTQHLLGIKNGATVMDHKPVKPEDLEKFVGKDIAAKLAAQSITKQDRFYVKKRGQSWYDVIDRLGRDYNYETMDKNEASTYASNKNQKSRQYTRTLGGLDLKVGGEGMKAFYDKMLVDKANAIGKKFGAKVEWKDMQHELKLETLPRGSVHQYKVEDLLLGGEPKFFDTVDKAKAYISQYKSLQVPVLRLTPALRDAATGKGFPLFARGLPFSFNPVDHDPFKKHDDPFDHYFQDLGQITQPSTSGDK